MGQPSEKQILLSDYQAARNVADLALKREEELIAQLAALRQELDAELESETRWAEQYAKERDQLRAELDAANQRAEQAEKRAKAMREEFAKIAESYNDHDELEAVTKLIAEKIRNASLDAAKGE